MKLCPHCGHSNLNAIATCQLCGKKFQDVGSGDGLQVANKERLMSRFVSIGIVSIGALLILTFVFLQEYQGYQKEQAHFASQLASLDRAHEEGRAGAEAVEQKRVKDEDAAYRNQLQDKDFLAGTTARKRHAEEWQRRLAHDPALADSILEATLLEMERLGKDPSIAAPAALEKVAKLASPPNSRVEVLNEKTGLNLRIAFKMSDVTEHEKGIFSKHLSKLTLRREIEELSAQLVKDVFDACGSRRIERLSVSCNHAVNQLPSIPLSATEAERKELLRRAKPNLTMASLYRVVVNQEDAIAISSWREVSVSEVVGIMRVEHDGLPELIIQGGALNYGRDDSNMPLEF